MWRQRPELRKIVRLLKHAVLCTDMVRGILETETRDKKDRYFTEPYSSLLIEG